MAVKDRGANTFGQMVSFLRLLQNSDTGDSFNKCSINEKSCPHLSETTACWNKRFNVNLWLGAALMENKSTSSDFLSTSPCCCFFFFFPSAWLYLFVHLSHVPKKWPFLYATIWLRSPARARHSRMANLSFTTLETLIKLSSARLSNILSLRQTAEPLRLLLPWSSFICPICLVITFFFLVPAHADFMHKLFCSREMRSVQRNFANELRTGEKKAGASD